MQADNKHVPHDMSNISANTLFHFTDRQALMGILDRGFLPKLSAEKCLLFNNFSDITYPMVCFCDIPLSEIKIHANKYSKFDPKAPKGESGRYALGMSKEWGVRNGINPILYITQSSPLQQQSNFFIRTGKELNDLYSKESNWKYTSYCDILYLSFFTKPYKKPRCKENNKYYDEREWRYVLPKKELMSRVHNTIYNDVPPYFLLNEKVSNKHWDAINTYNERFALDFNCEDIRYIIVESESDILDFVKYIRTSRFKHSADLLTTRLITMNRINNDF